MLLSLAQRWIGLMISSDSGVKAMRIFWECQVCTYLGGVKSGGKKCPRGIFHKITTGFIFYWRKAILVAFSALRVEEISPPTTVLGIFLFHLISLPPTYSFIAPQQYAIWSY